MSLRLLVSRLIVRSGLASLLPDVRRRLGRDAAGLRYYSDRLLASPLARLERLAEVAGPAPPDVIDLAGGSPRFEVVPGISARLPADRRGWPDVRGLPELRGSIAAKLLADNRLAFSAAEEVLVTSGALGAIQTVFDAFVNRGDAVVLPEPLSPVFDLAARTRGAAVRRIGTRCERGELKLRFDQLARAAQGARLIVLATPGNPTGAVLSPEDAEQVAWWAERNDALILSDEVYERFCYDADHHSPALVARNRTLTVGSVSKSHGLAHLRVGWLAGPRPLVQACTASAALRGAFVPTLSQLIAKQALDAGPAPVEKAAEKIEGRREYVCDRLRAMGVKAATPAAGLFAWAEVPEGWSGGESFAGALLRERKVRVVPGDVFGPSGRRFVRLSLTAEEGRLEAGLDRMAEMVRGEARRISKRAA